MPHLEYFPVSYGFHQINWKIVPCLITLTEYFLYLVIQWYNVWLLKRFCATVGLRSGENYQTDFNKTFSGPRFMSKFGNFYLKSFIQSEAALLHNIM